MAWTTTHIGIDAPFVGDVPGDYGEDGPAMLTVQTNAAACDAGGVPCASRAAVQPCRMVVGGGPAEVVSMRASRPQQPTEAGAASQPSGQLIDRGSRRSAVDGGEPVRSRRRGWIRGV